MVCKRQLLANDRGAVFLLAIYFSALILLLVGGVSLQRTNTEVRAAQVSRDLQQAFWLSESALDHYKAQTRQVVLEMNKELPAGNLPAQADSAATFSVKPIDAEIVDMTGLVPDAVMISGKQLVVNPYQKVTREVTGTGQVGGKQVKVHAYTQESEPLQGIWANKTIGVAAGRGLVGNDIVVRGDLHSGLGSVVSTIDGSPGQEQLAMHGVIKLNPDALSGPEDQKLAAWASQATSELKSVKNAYKLLQGIPTALDNYDKVDFTSSAATETAEHVSGSLSVGMSNTSKAFGGQVFAPCHGTLLLSSGKTTTIDKGFSCVNGVSNTAGVSCVGAVSDLSADQDYISICANAIVPGTASEWVNSTVGGQLPHLIFRQPTSLILYGSRQIDTVVGGVGTPLPSPFSALDTLFLQNYFQIQANWQVTLAAKISGIGSLGQELPIKIFEQKDLNRPDSSYGIVYVQPGDNFSGSIFTPESLVVLRKRACADTPAGCTSDLDLQYVVGNEVAIELEKDAVQIGGAPGDKKDSDKVSVDFLSWSNVN